MISPLLCANSYRNEMQVLDDKVKHLQLINAVSSNNIDGVLNAIFKINSNPQILIATSYGSPLHLVVSLCHTSIVENVISIFCSSNTQVQGESLDWINYQNSPERETPLHIAAKLARLDILEMLLQVPRVNETIRDSHGNTPQESCSHNEAAFIIFEKYKSEFIGIVIAQIKNAAETLELGPLDDFINSSQRAQCFLKQGWIDINCSLEPINERSLLHLAAKADNSALLAWALKYGADPKTSDKKQKKPIDLAKTEKIKEILRHAKTQAPIISSSLAQATSSLAPIQSRVPLTFGAKDPPVLKGILSKWTNYKDGYQPRYFVLEAGVLSYYQDIKDYPSVCRGSISTLSADTIFPDSTDLSRFDVIGTGSIKFSLKSRSPADSKRWVWALKESRMWLADSTKLNGIHSRQGSSSNLEPEGSQLQLLLSPVKATGSIDNVAHVNLSTQSNHEHTEGPKDLYSFLDNHGSNELQNPELRRFLTLLKTEMQVQKETVQSAVDALQEAAGKDDEQNPVLKTLPSILNDSGQHIESLILGIVRYCIKREAMWEQKLNKSIESHKRLEDILQQIAGNPSNEGLVDVKIPAASSIVVPKPIMMKKVATNPGETYSSSSEDEHDDEEFYDAQEGSLSPQLNLTQLVMTNKSAPPDYNNDEFCSLRDLEESAKGYSSILPWRQVLPLDPSKPKPSLAVWSFLKNAIGKDLSKVTLPVLFNEPISMLQRMCEDIEFIELLSLASRVGSNGFAVTKDHPMQPAIQAAKRLNLDYAKLESLKGEDASLFRLMFVGAFAMSNYSSTTGRTNKPFNPMLGETYELVDEAKQFRYLSEQVCHHPPISACHCDSPEYSFWTEVYVKSKFWGKSLELHPLGNCHVSLPVYDGKSGSTKTEHYSWKKVTTCVNNLILGPLAIEHYGDLVVTNHRTGETCTVVFKPKDPGGWFVSSKDAQLLGGDLGGIVKDSKGNIKFELSGRWDESLHAIPITSNSYSAQNLDLWRVNEKPAKFVQNFNLTSFGLMMNQITPELDSFLPVSDSRKRPDQRAMELGEWAVADAKKDACENMQRARRKDIVQLFEQTGVPYGPPASGLEFGEKWWTPRWFIREIEPDTKEGHWRFSRKYWQFRQRANDISWPAYTPDLFSESAD